MRTALLGVKGEAARAGPHYPQRLLLIADWGLSYNSSSTLDHALASARNASGPASVLFVGDYSYAGARQADKRVKEALG